MTNPPQAPDDARHPDLCFFQELAPYMERVSRGGIGRTQTFSLCVRASVAKCYEFNLLLRRDYIASDAFFLVPSLRGICEDLIVLNYMKTMPRADRAELVRLSNLHEFYSRVGYQSRFFSSFRPQQPVVRIEDVEKRAKDAKTGVQRIWRKHGWPNLSKAVPPTIEIAHKQGQPVLAFLYEFLFRLTSGAVHFGVHSLLRLGWGDNTRALVFSTKNFQPCFEAYATVYGAVLFCIYFEFFGRYLRPGATNRKAIARIRGAVLRRNRWPEMVTWEELNKEPPTGGEILRMLANESQAASMTRFIR